MSFLKNVTIAIGFMLLVISFNAAAQWSPVGQIVYMGDLNLATSSDSDKELSLDEDVSDTSQITSNNLTMNDSTLDNSTIAIPTEQTPSSSKKPLDLSSYSRDRANKNLEGYTNIMYPISGSRGTTATTAGSGGCGCG